MELLPVGRISNDIKWKRLSVDALPVSFLSLSVHSGQRNLDSEYNNILKWLQSDEHVYIYMVHKYPIYRCSGVKCSLSKPSRADKQTVLSTLSHCSAKAKWSMVKHDIYLFIQIFCTGILLLWTTLRSVEPVAGSGFGKESLRLAKLHYNNLCGNTQSGNLFQQFGSHWSSRECQLFELWYIL